MAESEYDAVYVARSPASMRQDDFATMMDELCNSRAVSGWRLANAVGDYGVKVTLGVWLFFIRERAPDTDDLATTVDASEELASVTKLEESLALPVEAPAQSEE